MNNNIFFFIHILCSQAYQFIDKFHSFIEMSFYITIQFRNFKTTFFDHCIDLMSSCDHEVHKLMIV